MIEAADYDMWDCCFVQIFSYGKEDERAPSSVKATRSKAKEQYDALLDIVWYRTKKNLDELAPREWPLLPFLSEDEQQKLLDWHPTAVPLRALSDYDLRLVQRLLCFARTDFMAF